MNRAEWGYREDAVGRRVVEKVHDKTGYESRVRVVRRALR